MFSCAVEAVIVPISGTTATEIVGSVRDLIASGELVPRDLLPPVRTLAAELGVNRNTVAAAYRQLVAAGVAATHGRGGTMVAGMVQLAREGAGFGGRLIDLASGNPDPELLPDVLAAARRGEYRQPLYGAPAVEDPCFLGTIGTVRLNGYRTAPVAVDHAGMRPEALRAALESGARAVVCTPRAHNPTGASLTAGRAAELRAILAEHPQVLIIEDDHFSAVSTVPYHRITPPRPAAWALVRSVSKFLGPDLRLALVAAGEETARRLETRLSAGTMWVSHLLRHTARELLLDPKARAQREQARTAYAERSARLMKEINACGISTPAAYRPDGLNVWIDLDTQARPVVGALARRGWLVRPGDLFATGQADRQALRVTTATLTEQRAREFAADLAAVLDHPDAA
ncbi:MULTISPECIES: aminotransferase class I/II-fold pyridoxal phosphate-dependent enzyme [Streptomyces]|uniref:Aminotransferase class I/II-fold pyridoxal phosphate-dependent enzyme n=1 Tax=Streptomyces lonegramiae TaxID=3075524 RepID=A0ABU2X6S1_9ACTN|nr:aminotransferase class I/II-fold pyridoxal phosphate-dependent enzyme [Streptomyces sp. DSM 41529]MDT0541245.1 aminotransferase class I/II-fold pyridoxal phosphate-dependent enzyme [Streptomyces sp. DSM 41529]